MGAETRSLRLLAAGTLAIIVLLGTQLVSAATPGVGVAGGAVTAVMAANGKVYAGAGARLLVFQPDASAPSGYSRSSASAPLTDLVRGIAVQNGRAYVAAGAAGLCIFDVSQSGDPVALGSLATPGYAEGVAVVGTHAFVADGPLGLRVVDVSNPARPVEVGSAFEGRQAMAVTIRDHYALVAAGGAGLLVGDVANPAQPVELAGAAMTGYAAGIVLKGNYAYLMDSWGGIGIVNVANPAQPILVSTYATPGWALKGAITGNTLVVADAYRGVRQLDLSDPLHPSETASSEASLGDANDVAIDGARVWIADRYAGLTAGTLGGGLALTPAYDTFARAWSVTIAGNYAYVAAMERGLRIVDISDPAHPLEVGVYPVCNAASVTVNGSYAYLSVFFGGDTTGFHVVDVSDPRNPKRAGFIPLTVLPMNVPRDHTSVGTISYVTNETGLIVIDAANPASPVVAGFAAAPAGGPTLGVVVRNNVAYVAQESGGLDTFDVSNPRAPKLLGTETNCNSPQDVDLFGNYAIVAGMGGSCVVDVSDPAHPHALTLSGGLGPGRGVSVSGSLAYLASSGAAIQAFDLTNPAAPAARGSYALPGYARKGVVQGDRLWIADAELGLWSVPLASLNQAQSVPARARADVAPRPAMLHSRGGSAAVPAFAPLARGGRRKPASAHAEAASSSCVVSTNADAGAGSLRACLAAAVSGGTIVFDAAAFPPGSPRTIRLQSELPAMANGHLTVDGSSAGVILDGSQLGAAGNGLTVFSNGNTIQGLQLINFSGAAVLVSGGASQNTIGGDRTQGTGPQGRGNLFQMGGIGIVFSGAGTSNNVAIGNFLGTSSDGMQLSGWGSAAGTSSQECVAIAAGATSNRFGSTVAGERNVLGNCGWPAGMVIEGDGTEDNAVIGNYFGLNATGSGLMLCGDSPCPIVGGGQIYVQGHAARNRIGGTQPGEGNVISGAPNTEIGINDYGTADNAIIGNFIGTDAAGRVPLSDTGQAIWLDGASARTLIQGNVVSGGLAIAGDYNVVVGNRVGTDVAGKIALGGYSGVTVPNMRTRRNRVGGTAPGEANLLSGSGSGGEVSLDAPGTEEIYVIGNLIGTDVSGTASPQGLAFTSQGPLVQLWDGAKRNVIGGSIDAEANVIAGGGGAGISLNGSGVSHNLIGRNWIGTNRNDVPAIANHGDGIASDGDRTFILGNRIAFNGGLGVSSQGNAAIRGNFIHDNASGGILVQSWSATSAPVISEVSATSARGTACGACTVEIFSDAANQGGTFEGAVRAAQDGTFQLSKAGGFRGPNLTATATSPTGLTSQFSAPLPAAPRLDVSITHGDNYSQPQTGRSYTVVVTNSASAGPTAGVVTVTNTVSSGVTLVSISGLGWNCAADTCTRSDALLPGASYPPIAVTVNVAANAPAHGADQVSVSGGGSVTASALDSALDGSMAHLAVAGGWETTLTLLNLGPTQALAHLSFFGDDGNALPLPVSSPQLPASSDSVTAAVVDRTLAGNSLVVLESAAPADPIPHVGSAQLLSSGALNGFAIFKNTASGQEATVPLETASASSYTLVYDNTGGLVTGVALANIATVPATIPVVLQDDNGAALGTGTISLPAQGHKSFVLTQDYPATAGQRGSMRFETPAGGQISALGLRVNGTAVTSIPVLASSAPGGGTLTHIASGGGWQTTITLVNPGATPAQAHLEFHDNSGAALPLELAWLPSGASTVASTLDLTFDAGATLTLATQGAGAPTEVDGSAQLTTDGAIGAYGIFRNDSTGQEAVVPLESRNANAYVLAFDNTNGLLTGLALANSATGAVKVPVILRDDTGAMIDSTSVSLAGQGHASFLLTSLSAATANQRGTIEFDVPAGSQIGTLGLRFTPSGVFTTIPVVAK